MTDDEEQGIDSNTNKGSSDEKRADKAIERILEGDVCLRDSSHEDCFVTRAEVHDDSVLTFDTFLEMKWDQDCSCL